MEVGCPRHPGASTIKAAISLMKTAPMAGKFWQPSHYEEHAPVTLLKQWKEGGKGDGRGTAWATSCRYRIARKMPPVCTSRYDPQTRGIPTHALKCRHRWLLGERKRSLLLTLLNCI